MSEVTGGVSSSPPHPAPATPSLPPSPAPSPVIDPDQSDGLPAEATVSGNEIGSDLEVDYPLYEPHNVPWLLPSHASQASQPPGAPAPTSVLDSVSDLDLDFRVFHRLPDSTRGDGTGMMLDHQNPSQPNQCTRADETPCIFLIDI